MNKHNLIYRLHNVLYRRQRTRITAEVDGMYREILNGVNKEEFRARFQKYYDPFSTAGPAKFLDLNVWLREAVYRYMWTGVNAMGTGLNVLDLGAGTGYFLLVCRHNGHDVLGLDVDEEPFYNDSFEFLKLPRRIHRIEPMTPLPDMQSQFDLITAFMTCFDTGQDGMPWGADAWKYFVQDLRSRLKQGGRTIIQFNENPHTGEFYSREAAAAIKSTEGFRVKFFLNYVFLRAN